MESLWQDLRFSFRTLRAAPSFTAVAILTLALGIGANGAMFSVVSEVLLRPTPVVKEAHRLVVLGRSQDGRGFENFSHPGYLDYRDHTQAFSGLMACHNTPLNLSYSGSSERVNGALVSGNYFSVLGVDPTLGRTFLAEEDGSPSAHPVAVVSYRLWQRRFGSDRNLVGQILTLNGTSFTVVGIMPERFTGIELGETLEIWIPLAMEAQARPFFPVLNTRMFSGLRVVGRLKPGLTVEQAQAELNVLARQFEEPDAQTHKQKQVAISSEIRLPDPEWRAMTRDWLAILMAVVGLVLLSACANVANLLLARATARRREIAVRLAVGASRTRLIRQFLTESVLISLLGGGIGVGVAFWMIDLLQLLAFLDPGLNLTLDLGAVGFMFLLALFSGIVFGLAPALQTSKPDLVPALKDMGTLGSYRGSRLRSLLVIVQVASSLILMIGAGLFVKNLQNLQAINLGFETKHVLFTPLDLRLQGYNEATARTFYQRLTERVEALPGVQSVSLSSERPISGFVFGIRDILIEGQIPSRDGRGTPVDQSEVAPKYFDALGIHFVRGRDFNQHDQKGNAGVVMINEAMARRFWPGEDPIGKRLSLVQFMAPPGPLLQVVGVVKDTRFHRLDEKVRPHLYLPLAQNFQVDEILYLRTGADPRSLIPEVRRVVKELDRELPVFEIRTLSDWIDELNRDDRMTAALIGVFGLLALVLAAAGLYGVISYMVSQREREIGVRVALGASARDVLKLVVRQGLLLTLKGVVIGLALALALTRIIAHWLYGVSATDPASFATAAVLLAAGAFIASYYPARKATKVDPMVALRSE